MNLDKAIELYPEIEDSLRKHGFIPQADAVKMGAEALKRVKWNRTHKHPSNSLLLPGEAPEIDTNRSLHHIKEVLENPEVRK